MTPTPTVSIVMAVRDGARWLTDALASIRAQSFQDWELVVVNDGSRDETGQLLAMQGQHPVFKKRLHVVTLSRSFGLATALNAGVRAGGMQRIAARAYMRRRPSPLIARLDVDDWMKPTRLERQVAWLQQYPNIGVVGSAVQEIGASETNVRFYPLRDAEIRRAMIRANALAHSAVMFRRSVFDEAGGYDESYPVAQDLDLWLRMLPLTEAANLAEALTVRRLHPGQVSAKRRTLRRLMEARARWAAIRRGTYSVLSLPWVLRPLLGVAVRAA